MGNVLTYIEDMRVPPDPFDSEHYYNPARLEFEGKVKRDSERRFAKWVELAKTIHRPKTEGKGKVKSDSEWEEYAKNA